MEPRSPHALPKMNAKLTTKPRRLSAKLTRMNSKHAKLTAKLT